MGMMMVQQRSEQSSREADRMARDAELSLRREEIAMHREEMTSQLQIQHKESHAHQQMMNVMPMAMMQNIAGTNQQQRRTDSGANEHQSAGQFSRTMRTMINRVQRRQRRRLVFG